MSRVGNDVVDLDEPDIQGSSERPRLLERLLTPAERHQVEAMSGPARHWALWARFAAKEATYKALVKDRPGVLLAHRAYEVAADLSSVRHGEDVVRLEVERVGRAVHAVAWRGANRPSSGWATLRAGDDPSRAVRSGLLGALGITGAEVVRDPRPESWDGFGPPRLVRQGVALPWDVSLSHDGRAVAWAWVPRPASPERCAKPWSSTFGEAPLPASR